jgi:hypothetical protein
MYNKVINVVFQLVVQEVGIKFAQSHFIRGVRAKNVLVLSHIVMDYIKVRTMFFSCHT